MKLSLRELFLLVVIAAMGCGWWLSARETELRGAREAKAMEKWKHWKRRAYMLKTRVERDGALRVEWSGNGMIVESGSNRELWDESLWPVPDDPS